MIILMANPKVVTRCLLIDFTEITRPSLVLTATAARRSLAIGVVTIRVASKPQKVLTLPPVNPVVVIEKNRLEGDSE